MSGGVNWTEAELARLASLCGAGATIDELLAAFPSRTANALRNKAWLQSLKIVWRPVSNDDRAIWRGDRLTRLLQMWNEGSSQSEIARSFGVTKSAVAGALRRNKTTGDRRGSGKPSLPVKPPDIAPATVCASLANLGPKQCRFIEGDTYCGAPCGGAYCPKHRARMVQPFTRKTTPAEFIRSCRRYA